MNFKPFKRPSFKQEEDEASATSNPSFQSTSQTKRRRLSPDNASHDEYGPKNGAASKVQRSPLQIVKNPRGPIKPEDGVVKGYFSTVWRKVTGKKNKTWEDDGVLVYRNGAITAYNSKGHRLGGAVRDKMLEAEDLLSISGKDIQIESRISYNEFCQIVGRDNSIAKNTNVVIFHGEAPDSKTKPAPKMSLQEQMRQQIQKEKSTKPAANLKTAKPPTARNAAFRQPLKDTQSLPKAPSEVPVPRHPSDTPDAIVFKRPKRVPAGKQIVDVVLDPLLTKHLRDHQREGVKFLYECVMGLRNFNGQGCILADDMGLGKTLQTIALIWTLTKQNPVYKDDPVVKKVLIVCPVTLVQNWRKEFRKWLGRDRIGVMSYGDEGSRLSMFDGRNFKVMIVGYERLQKIAEDLSRGAGIDLVICDEGHRLKSLQNKSAKAIAMLNTSRRVILSGTPIQNDLNEFFAMVNFVNDGVLGTSKAFTKDFGKPIMQSRQPDATEADKEKGQDRSIELSDTTAPFILRRTADILSQYLPTKTEYVLFCSPTPEQANIYRQVLQTPMFKSALGSNEGALQMITILKKLCNSPVLLKPKQGADESTKSTSLKTLNGMMPRGLARSYHNMHATKIRLLDELLHNIRNTTDDKIVLVSNYTATLDLMQALLSSLNMNFRRLDGSVPADKRQGMVDEFNRSSPNACFAFLLSAKAGGIGINLIGANRLILFDVDWNPATDDQAMARIHREGQKKPCYIYRFLIKGALEERIWQRQVVKRGLANSIMEGSNTTGSTKGEGKAAFSMDELKDLFRLDESEGLRTHDLIGCNCKGQVKGSADEPIDEEHKQRIHDIDEIDSEDDDGPIQSFSFTAASQLTEENLADQEASISTGSSPRKSPSKKCKQQEDELQELMSYAHIDTSNTSKLEQAQLECLTDAVNDPCLMHVLKQGRDVITGNIAYMFLRNSRDSTLADVQDDDDSDGAEG